jgi:cellulose synthase/poly-beta-1,6-N-acetylglucosamine synthase-like glycosyltransferase
MGAWEWGILGAHALVSTCLFVYALHMYALLFLFWRSRRHPARMASNPESWPAVTVQIPLYNERCVARRAIEAVCALDYPHDRLEIQILDDSTDETRGIVEEQVELHRARGIDISVLRRIQRTEFKAGALQNGLLQSRGEFVAVFDADFVPSSDWLRAIVPDLAADPGIGWVQTRWGHLNQEESWLTRAQAIGIDGHFVVEQGARAGSDLFANFNGTAGLWRKKAILDAGGWTGDTLTEDLDLSYRAQLRGWRMRYRPDVVVPAELPAEATALKSQQFRWAKGSIQTSLKLLKTVWSSDAGFLKKVAATIHLTSYSIHVFMLLSVLLALPMLYVVQQGELPPQLMTLGMLFFVLGSFAPILLYTTCQTALYPDPWRRVAALPVLMALGMGVSVSNGQAVLEALVGRKTPFIRTPKRGDRKRSGYRLGLSPIVILEVLFGMGCAFTASLYSAEQLFSVAALMGLYACGFVSVGLLTWKDYIEADPRRV